MDPIESRRAIRKNLMLKGTFKIRDDLKYKLHIYREPADLSLTDVALLGCGFTAAYYLPKGIVLSVKLKDFPLVSPGAQGATKDMDFTAKVMSCRNAPGRTNKIGIEFVDIRKEYLDLIKNFIQSGA